VVLFLPLLQTMAMKKKKDHGDSALRVNKGIKQPPPVNDLAAERFKASRWQDLSVEEYVEGILTGQRVLLSRAITLSESALSRHQEIAQQVIGRCLPYAGRSVRVGITGVPGVGKSTFIETLGRHLTSSGHRIAVLAIDPSSQRTKGSILGDKTRMEELANDPNAFIRPSASSGTLGGVTRKTRETIILCEAAGFDTIFVETVGVGQSETAVHSMVDFFLLLMLAGAGDELQGIKRGIMEMADAIIINKADGDNIPKAERAKREYENALHLFPPSPSGWIPKVLTCSAVENTGVREVWGTITTCVSMARGNGWFESNRKEQSMHAFISSIEDTLLQGFYNDPHIKETLKKLKEDILSGNVNPYTAAQELIRVYLGK
jgi:LAO/AO transport system kinase